MIVNYFFNFLCYKAMIGSSIFLSKIKEGFAMWNEEEDGTQGIAGADLIPMLVKSIQELSAEVEKLKQK